MTLPNSSVILGSPKKRLYSSARKSTADRCCCCNVLMC
ncbi:hypothetical protein B4U79_09173 [Dinothrombium tinctorium]|uniref:Uncharacterized protein n=1 Tax=Dinothrombium tinctorium TaxID=1965070 RepID=A0A3S3SN16_9ACAR|nr:hypothetical protein B4U79_09173 [Dinothrombium tinctorium]